MSLYRKHDNMNFSEELRVSHQWILVLLVIVGLGLFQLGDTSYPRPENIHFDHLGLLLFALLILVWLINNQLPRIGRWLTVTLVITVIVAGARWLEMPMVWALLIMPTLLGAALIGLTGGFVIALAATFMVELWEPTTLDPSLTAGNVSLLLVWSGLAIMRIVYQPVYSLAQWAWDYYQQAHTLLLEAQVSKMELAQALDDLKHANLQLTRMNLLAQGLRRAAEEAHTAKAEFVANVSHELRTPLNMITGFSEMILQSPDIYGKPLPATLLADLAVIYRNAEHLSHLIDDVLDLSQIDADQMALTKEYANFADIIQEAITAVRPLYHSRGLRLDVTVPEDLPAIFCDRTRIREVLLNLLSNAGRYTDHGGVCLEAQLENNGITISVSDTGPGIAPEDLDKLFRPFSQVDGSIRRQYGGTGLGLSISQRFVELHGGKIWVQSIPGQGTTFSFKLPTDMRPRSARDSWRQIVPGWEYIERQEPSKAPKPIPCPRFIVVESGNSLCRLLNRYWDEVEVTQVANLVEARAELAREPAQALLINDLSVSDSLRELSAAPLPDDGTPTIICSLPDTSESASTLNAAERLVKPISRETLLGALERLGVFEGTILIVDDEPDALHLFGRVLSTSGRQYRILLARDGQEALTVLADTRPDAILLDLVMPHMDGFQLLKQRSLDPDLVRIPVVIISAQDPVGQPIVSSALAVTRPMGLSVSQLLGGIKALSQSLSPANQIDGPILLEMPDD